MAEWIVCPNCNLHHSVRPTRICPRCKLSIDGGPASSAETGVAPAPPPPAAAVQAPVTPAVARPSPPVPYPRGASDGCVNHPEVTNGLVSCRRCGRRFCQDCVVALRGSFFCIDCKGEQVRDLQSGLQPGMLEFASVGRRFGALFLDNLLTMIGAYAIIIPVVLIMASLTQPHAGAPHAAASGLSVLLLFVVYGVAFGLPVTYEALMLSSRGQTVGKIALGVKVVSADGSDISAGQAWGRAVLKVILASCVAATYWPALFTEEKTTLHDLIVKTRVVRLQS
jgi:uncharacterized RDD family membrane protein YckC